MKTTLLFTSFLRFAALCGAAVLALAAPSSRAADPGVPPTIYNFNVFGMASINRGETATLNWSISDATSVSISPDVGDVTGTWQVTVAPQVTTTYVLTASNSAGTVTRTRTITVIALPQIAAFTASAATVEAGAPATLSWNVAEATSVSIAPGIGAVTGTSVTVHPTKSTTYTLTATNASGSVTKTVTVQVPEPPAVVHSLTASPAVAYPGQPVTLTWEVTGTESLWMSADNGGDPGSMNFKRSTVVHPQVSTRYVISAWSPVNGSVAKAVHVEVSLPPPPTIGSFTATPATMPKGSTTTLAWTTAGATEVSIAADLGTSPGVVTGNSLAVSPTATTTYTLTAKNITATVTATLTVTVLQPPTIQSFAAVPASITLGESTQLQWAVTGATGVSISANLGASPGVVTGNSVTVSPTGTTLYTLTANGPGGTITQTIPVNVSTPVPLPVIASFTASPETISSGSSTLSWSVTGATSLSIMANVGGNPGIVTGTSYAVSPTQTTIYTLSATNATGTVTKTKTVTVTSPGSGVVIHSFTATPNSVTPGQPVLLQWVVSGTSSLWMSADNGGDPGSMNGKTSHVVHPLVTTRYAISAWDPQQGTVGKSVIVTVVPAPPPPAIAAVEEATIVVAAEGMPEGAVDAALVVLEDGVTVATVASRTGGMIEGAFNLTMPASVTRCLVSNLPADAGYTVTAAAVEGGVRVNFAPGGALLTSAEGRLAVEVSAGGVVAMQ